MFIEKRVRCRLTPSGVKCTNLPAAHGTPDGVRAPYDSFSINIELLTEFRRAIANVQTSHVPKETGSITIT